jgi:hypothetical protein
MTVITYFIPFLYLFAAAWKYGNKASGLAGVLVTAIAILLSLVPPPDAASVWLFELKLAGGCGLLIALARMFFNAARRKL